MNEFHNPYLQLFMVFQVSGQDAVGLHVVRKYQS